MGNLQDTDRASTAVEASSPGQRLRQAREARQLTRDAVALQMRIEPKVIEALERDDYAQLPAAVFVRGYLRAYAKLVGLVAEPLVDAFDQRTTHTPPPLVLPTAVGPDMERRSGYTRWIVFVLAALSLLLFYQWWRLDGSKPSQVANVPNATAPAQVTLPAQKTETDADTTVTAPVPEPAATPEILDVIPSDESGLDDAAVVAPAPAPAAPAPVAPVPATTAPAPASSESAAEPTPPPEPQATPAAAGPLVLHFTADCWVVIRDAGGRALLQGLIQAGERKVLDGKPPYQVTLGNAPGVEIEYQGQRFDHSRYTGASNIARFTLGK